MFITQSWFLFAIGAALMWGFGYALSEYVLQNGVRPSFLMLFETFIGFFFCLIFCWYKGTFSEGVEILSKDKWMFLAAFAVVVTVFAGNYFIFSSIALKNATLTNIIEISYPFFTLLFTWLLFKQFHLNWGTALGGLLVLSGLVLIFLKSKA